MNYEETVWLEQMIERRISEIVKAIRKIPGRGELVRIPNMPRPNTLFISIWLWVTATGVWVGALALARIADKL